MEWWQAIVIVCGGIISFAGVVVALGHIYKPVKEYIHLPATVRDNEFKTAKRMADIEEIQLAQAKMMRDSEMADKLLCKAMIAIIDNRLTGNSHDNLRGTKEELMKFVTI